MRRIDTMGFTKLLLRILVTTSLIVLVSSCLTDRSPLHVQDRPVKTQNYAEVTATLRFVDEAILKAKYKDEVNPFLTDYNAVQLRRVIVFELTVENQSPDALLFVMNRIELQYGGKALQPYNRFQLNQHWEFTDEEAKAIYKSRREKIIEQMVLPNSYTLQAGGIMRGYVVFLGSTPNYGSATVYVPLFEIKDRVFHRFEFPFEF
jgi:homospermidine synthase